MAKIIRKHWDITLTIGIGLCVVIMAMLLIDLAPPVPSVEAATTSATTVTVSATVASSISLTLAAVNTGVAVVTGVTTTVTTTVTSTPFGTVDETTNQIAAHTLTVTTNATNGYTTNAKYSAALTNAGSDTIDDWTGINSAPTEPFQTAGTEAFGYTTDDALLGEGDVDRFVTTTGGMWAKFEAADKPVAYLDAATASDVTKIGYQIAVAATTEAGTYTNTVTYTAVGSF